jgi:hypothetical protein
MGELPLFTESPSSSLLENCGLPVNEVLGNSRGMREPGCREPRRKVGLAFMWGEGNRLASPAVNYFDHDRKEQSCQGMIGVPLFASCLEVVFSETQHACRSAAIKRTLPLPR